jgi:lipoyl(octanoyl) transferase
MSCVKPLTNIPTIGFKLISQQNTYKKVSQLQEYLVRNNSKSCNVLLLVEHSPVYSVGRRIKKEPEEYQKIQKLGAEFEFSQRGGRITFHGPGQLVGYPILNLRDFQLGARCYVDSIENTLIDLLSKYGISGKKTENTGIWVENEKIAAIGIHIQRHITSHGFGLNCNTDLTWFDHIVPCGLPLGATSITKQLGRNVTIEQVTPHLLDSFSKVFKAKVEDLKSVSLELDQEIDMFLQRKE